MMPDDALVAAQAAHISTLQAHGLSTDPYHNPRWPVDGKDSFLAATSFNPSLRVYYLSRYFPSPSSITPLLVHVPFICTGGDSDIETQDGQYQPSLAAARKAFPTLISDHQRRLSRNKCITSLARVYAVGGYRSPLKRFTKEDCFDCIVVSGAGPQFEAKYLDYADFVVTPADGRPSARLPQYAHFGTIPSAAEVARLAQTPDGGFVAIGGHGSGLFLHAAGYLASMTECAHLWLSAFDDAVRRAGSASASGDQPPDGAKKGYMKVSAIGTGFFADVAGAGTNIGRTLMPLLLRAFEQALQRHAYAHVAALEFPDFSPGARFTPTRGAVNGVALVAAPRRDVLDFPAAVRRECVVGLLNPGDCFACVGNERGYASVEAMIGNNTTVRTTQCYVWNERILDEANYVPVDD